MTECKESYSTIKLNAGNSIEYVILDGRTVEIYTNTPHIIEQKDESQNIISLSIENYTIGIGTILHHNYTGLPSSYEVNYIYKGATNKSYKHRYTLRSHIRNRCSLYILPILGKTLDFFGYNTYFINSYISKDCKELKLLYRFATTQSYSKLEKTLTSLKPFKRVENIKGGFDLFTFEIDDENYLDVDTFLAGKYSKISTKLKNGIKNFHKMKPGNRILQVLNKDTALIEEMAKVLNCNVQDFYGVDLDIKPKLNEEIWEYQKKN